MITGDNPLTACHVGSQLKLIEKKHALVLTKDSNGADWCWQSIINDSIRRPVEFALQQKNYPKWNRHLVNEADDKYYNYLCLTGEVKFYFIFI